MKYIFRTLAHIYCTWVQIYWKWIQIKRLFLQICIEINPDISHLAPDILEMKPDISHIGPHILEMNPDISHIEIAPDILDIAHGSRYMAHGSIYIAHGSIYIVMGSCVTPFHSYKEIGQTRIPSLMSLVSNFKKGSMSNLKKYHMSLVIIWPCTVHII